MQRFGLIGHPVAGSLSPALFAAAYDGRYAYDLLDFPRFEDAWNAFLNGYDGINVTAPFKQDAFAAVSRLSENARLCGAVNLVVRSGADLVGYNTDVDGVVGALSVLPGSPSVLPGSPSVIPGLTGNLSALVVGTGGAARAAARAVQLLGCRVTVTGRSLEKAAALGYPAVSFQDAAALRPSVIIYTLPSSAPVPAFLTASPASSYPAPTGYLSNAIVLEAEYKHPALDQVHCRRYISGKQWLLHQAFAGYRLFTGEEPSFEKMSAVL